MSEIDQHEAEPAYGPHPQVLFTELNESESVLLSLPDSRYYTLNETGSRIWKVLEAGATPTRVARSLEEGYEIGYPQALEHARAFVAELLQEGLVREYR